MSYYIGIDSGSTFTKTVLFENDKLLDFSIEPTKWSPSDIAQRQIKILCSKNNIHQSECKIISTGYGRESIKQLDNSITEITCHAKGALHLNSDIDAIIDIGGQDSKVILLHNGRIIDFIMNDKCAAGTGRFLSMICDRLEIGFYEIDNNVDLSNPTSINNMCAVFAESEVIGLLANGKARESVLAGVIISIAEKTCQLLSRVKLSPNSNILFTGGLSNIEVLSKAMVNISHHNIMTHQLSKYAGAIGAACSMIGEDA